MSRVAVGLALLCAGAPPLAAAPRAIVIEAVVDSAAAASADAADAGASDARPNERDPATLGAEIHAYLHAVVSALGTPLADRALAAAVDARFGPPPARLSASALAELAARTRQAERNLFFSGTRVRESIDDLEAARVRLGDAQATLAHDPEARALYQRVLLKLSRAYQVTRGPEAAQLADARMQELLRNVPDLPIDPARNERELVQHYERVRAAMPATARLFVAMPPEAHAFVEGQPVQGVRASYAGAYRLFCSGAHGDGRLHRVTVGRSDVRVRIDGDFEAALRSDRFVGFVYGSPSERAREEVRWVGQLARALDVTRVYVLTADAADGRPSVGVWGYAVDANGARLVAASTARAVAGRASVGEVARAAQRVAAALDGGSAAPGVTVMSGRVSGAPAIASARGDASRRSLVAAGWSAVAVGLPLTVAGAAVWHHGSNVESAALVTAGAGLAVAGTVWTLAATPAHRPRNRAAVVVSALWGAAAVVAAALAAR